MQMRESTRRKTEAGVQLEARQQSALAGRLGRRRGTAKFFDHVLEFGDVFEAPVNRSETNIGNRVERTQLVHHEFTEALAAHTKKEIELWRKVIAEAGIPAI